MTDLLLLISQYFHHSVLVLVERETDLEFDPILWRDDPNMDVEARACRDVELALDLTGNLDSCA